LKAGHAIALGVAGSLAFLVSCLLVGHGLLDSSLYSDLHVYATYGDKMAAGSVPYRDFFDEYPPLAQPVFLLARAAGASNFALAFKSLMALFGVGAIACAVVTLCALRITLLRATAAVAVIAAAPLLVGPIFLNAYDLWPAFLLSLALMLLVLDRPVLAFGVLGAAVAAKVYPVALLPIALVYVWPRLRRSALVSFASVLVLVHLPFAILGPGGLRFSYSQQAKRGLELNSIGGAFVLAAHKLGIGHPRLGNEPPGSLNVLGGTADAIAAMSAVLVLCAIVAAAVVFARSRRDPQALVVATAAAVAGFVAFDKVFSAQYVDWLVPLVPLAGLAASAATIVVVGLTRLVFSHRSGIQTGGDAVWLLFARDSFVVFVTVLLLGSVPRRGTVMAKRDPD
jgi:Glycosyltransferase family 87